MGGHAHRLSAIPLTRMGLVSHSPLKIRLLFHLDPFDQGRIIGGRSRTIDAPRHRPALQHVVRCGFEQRGSAIVEPGHEIFGFKNNRHAVMHFGDEIVRR